MQKLKLIKSFIRDEKLSVKEANNRLKNLLKSNEIEHHVPNTMSEKTATNCGSKQKDKINKELKQELLVVLRDMLNYLKSH